MGDTSYATITLIGRDPKVAARLLSTFRFDDHLDKYEPSMQATMLALQEFTPATLEQLDVDGDYISRHWDSPSYVSLETMQNVCEALSALGWYVHGTQGESYDVSAQVYYDLPELGVATGSLTNDGRPYIDSREVDRIIDAGGTVEEMTAALNRLTLRPWRDARHALELDH